MREESCVLTKLENERMEVYIKNQGAELTGIKLKSNGIQYLWQADPKAWGRHAPVLFPVVGGLKNDSYRFEGKTFNLAKHGFARDMDFETVSVSDRRVEYSLKSNEETLKVYPFEFELIIAYTLDGVSLTVDYKVVNTGDRDMLFSIGAHPAFNCPLEPGETMEDYILEFETEENADTYVIDGNLISDEKLSFLKDSKIVRLSPDMFRNDAIVLENLKSKWVIMKSSKTGKFVRVDFEGFPYLGIWSKAEGAPFLCIEPWYGIGDFVDATGNLEEKKGIMKLAKGQIFSCSHKITIG
jgi:galactose mutarotase-like enzyme